MPNKTFFLGLIIFHAKQSCVDRSLRKKIYVEQEKDFAKFLILINEFGLKSCSIEQDYIVEQDLKPEISKFTR